MAALQREQVVPRDIADNRHPRLLLDDRAKPIMHPFGAAIEDHAGDPGIIGEGGEPRDGRRKRKRGAARVHDQDRRRPRRARHVVAASAQLDAGDPVVIPHGAFHHGYVAPLDAARHQRPDGAVIGEERVQIAAAHADDATVELRIDVIGAAFERGGRQPPVRQRLQDSAGDRRFSRAARRSAYQQAGDIKHGAHPPSRLAPTRYAPG